MLQQFDPGMEYRPDWGLKQTQQQQASNGANSLGHQAVAGGAVGAAAGRVLRGAKVQGPPGGSQQPQGPRGQNGPAGTATAAQNPNAGPGPRGAAGQDDKS